MANTPESQNDGSIESAISSIIAPPPVENDEENNNVEAETESEDIEETDEEEVNAEAEESSDEESDESDVEAEDSQDTEEADSEEPVFTVKVDGTEKQVTLSELKRGYSGQEFVQKGMQEAAAKRKQAEEVYAALLNERQQLAQMYQLVQQGQIAVAPQPPSREMFESDPIGYMEAKLEYDDKLAEYQKQNEQFKRLTQQQAQAEQAARQAYLQQELQSLTAVIPELADPQKAGQVKEKLLSAGQAYGYSAEEISQAIDHRALHVLRDAMKYRELMAGKKTADAKASPAKKRSTPVKAGAKRLDDSSKRLAQQQTKLKRSGSIEDALSLILNTK